MEISYALIFAVHNNIRHPSFYSTMARMVNNSTIFRSAAFCKPVCNCMFIIFLARAPLKIFRRVVLMITVLVVHMIFTFGHRQECHGDKTMDFKWLAITIPAKHHEQSAGFILCGRQELTATLSSSAIHALDGINPASGTCRINSFPTRDGIQFLMWQ